MIRGKVVGKGLTKGINDLETWCKQNNRIDLLEEWDYSTNVFSPDTISYGSHKEVYWICKQGHHYRKPIHSRCKGTGCNKCSGITFEHRGKIFEEFPMFIEELDIDRNTYEEVKDVSVCSKRVIYWKCKIGHIYAKSANNKCKSPICPVCSNKEILIGYNDLATWCENNKRERILQEWDYELNDFSPRDVTFGSNRKAHFECKVCGYKWETVVVSRTLQNTDCNACSKRGRTSFPEQAIFHYVKKYFSDAINGDRKVLDGKELDIYIPSKKVAIEYDGFHWHGDVKKDHEKNELCEEKNIKLYRVREYNCPKSSDGLSLSFYYHYLNWGELNAVIVGILKSIGIRCPDVNIGNDMLEIKNTYYSIVVNNSLAALHPDIAAEWHPTKNNGIMPDMVMSETHDKYYWQCPICGREYVASVKNRVRMNSACPICGVKKRAISQSFGVINMDTKEKFASVNEAAKKYRLKGTSIAACCRGMTKTSGGFHWTYDDMNLAENQKLAATRRSKGN